MDNEVTNLIRNHRSIRKYTNEPIPDNVLKDILSCLQWAPSSHNVQAYSVIVIKNNRTKQQLSEVCWNQKWVVNCPVFLVFCIDFYRLKVVSEMNKTLFEINEVNNLLVGAVDTALAAENVFIAAKSHGIGGVFEGAIRSDPDRVVELLDLPKFTIPLFGLCLGYPADNPWQKPRLPQRATIHNETYQVENIKSSLEEYESISSDYYTRRTNGRRTTGWGKQNADYFSETRYNHMKTFITKQGLGLG